MMLKPLSSNNTVGAVFSMATSYSNAVKAQCSYHVGYH